MTEITLTVPVSELIPILSTIAGRDWEAFQEVEKHFIAKYGIEEWQEFFAYRLKPALDKESDKWLLIQWCNTGIVSVKDIT